MRVTIYIKPEIMKFIDEVRGLIPRSPFLVTLIIYALSVKYGYNSVEKKKISY